MRRAVLLLLCLMPTLAHAQWAHKTDTIAANGQCVTADTKGVSNGTVSVTGTWVGTLTFYSNIGTAAYDTLALSPLSGATDELSTTANGRWTFGRAYTNIRLCATAWTSGVAVVNILTTTSGGGGASGSGGGVASSVTQGSTPWVTSFGTPQHVIIDSGTVSTTLSGDMTVVQPTGNNLHVVVDSGALTVNSVTNPVAVTGTFYQATQPVSAASLPLPTGASTAAKQPALGTAGSASTDVLTVQGIASMTALKVDGSAVTQPVSGTFWQATQPVSGTVTANAGTGTMTVGQATGTNLHAVLDSGSTTAVTQGTAANLNATVVGTGTFAVQAAQSGTWTVQPGNTANTTAWKVDGSAVTQPVSLASVPMPTAFTTITTGQQAVTASAVVLPTTTASRVCIKVLAAGTQTVYFGPSGVSTSTGQELSPGDAWCGPLSNTNKLYVIAGSTGSTVAWEALAP